MAGGAAGYTDEDEDAPITAINVTPLVDVVLVLLIVFMITIPTIVASDILNERELSIRLPRASDALPLTARVNDLVINIEAGGRYMVGGNPKSDEELQELLRQAEVDNPGRVNVVIRADRACPWQFVVNVMNLCKAQKISSYSATTMD
jgi:biopolymer transport protein ExbD